MYNKPFYCCAPLLWAILIVTFETSVYAWYSPKSKIQYSCEAMCMGLYLKDISSKDREALEKRRDHTSDYCMTKSINCKQCINVCKWNPSADASCISKCGSMSQTSCSHVCNFIRRRYDRSPKGTCPPSGQMQSRHCTMIRCRSDEDCYKPSGSRCCHSDVCGNVCQNTTLSGVPPIPPSPLCKLTFKPARRGQGRQETIVLDWNSYDLTRFTQSMTFLIQIRLTVGYELKKREMSDWLDLVSSTNLGAQLSHLQLGTWYQFRLWTFSEVGSAGPGPISEPIRLEQEPKKPSRPRNIAEKKSRISAAMMVSITIRWDPPSYNDLPITKYQILWKQHYRFTGGEESSLMESRAWVPKDETQYTLQNLKLSTTYKIEVVAVMKYDDRELRSDPTTIYITTTDRPKIGSPSLPVGPQDPGFFRSGKNCSCGDNEEHTPVTLTKPFFTEDSLEVSVSVKESSVTDPTLNEAFELEWEPQVCIDQTDLKRNGASENKINLNMNQGYVKQMKNLRFRCHYQLRVQRLSSQGLVSAKWNTCFCTPACHDVNDRRGLNNCNLPESSIPDSPKDLNYKIKQIHTDKGLYEVSVKWHALSTGIKGYRVVWGPRLNEPVDEKMYNDEFSPHLDSKKAESKVIKSNMIQIGSLASDTLYIIQVQSIGERGDSYPSNIFFTTPGSKRNSQRFDTNSRNSATSLFRQQSLQLYLIYFQVTVFILLLQRGLLIV